MTDTDGSSWFRDAVNAARSRGRRSTVEPETAGESAEGDGVVVDDSMPPKVPDLGQGARGPVPSAGPTMGDVLRGAIAARRAFVVDEIEIERQLRTRSTA